MPNQVKYSEIAGINETWMDMGDGTFARIMATPASTPMATSGLTPYVLNSAVIGDSTASSATAGQTTRVHRMRLNVAGATTLTVKSGATVLEVLKFAAAGFLVYDFAPRPWYVTAANQPLVISNSAAVQVDGVVEFIKA